MSHLQRFSSAYGGRGRLLIGLVDSSFACLSVLEDEACQLFELMVEKAEDSETGLLLDVILQETRKHRELLKHLSNVFEGDSNVSGYDCEKQMGELFAQAVAVVHTVRDEVLRGMGIVDAAKKLVDFERGASEEYVTEMHVRVRALVQENLAVRKVLESIAKDEKGHVELLQLVIEIGSRR